MSDPRLSEAMRSPRSSSKARQVHKAKTVLTVKAVQIKTRNIQIEIHNFFRNKIIDSSLIQFSLITSLKELKKKPTEKAKRPDKSVPDKRKIVESQTDESYLESDESNATDRVKKPAKHCPYCNQRFNGYSTVKQSVLEHLGLRKNRNKACLSYD